MYLTKLTLNPRTRRVQRELANPYQLHRTLMAAFPAELPPGERVLYRIDVDARSGVPSVLLQSHSRPDWAWFGDPQARDYLDRAPQMKPFDLAFTPGQMLSFRLRANPTVKRWLPGDKEDPTSEKKPMRLPLTADEELLGWLARKGDNAGFRVLSATTHNEGSVVVRKPGHAGTSGRKLTFHAVLFEGVLQVTDPQSLWLSVQQGIGPAKGFGFGLLSLAPAR